MEKSGKEVNMLDAAKIEINSPEIDQAIEDINKIVEDKGPAIEDLMTEVRRT